MVRTGLKPSLLGPVPGELIFAAPGDTAHTEEQARRALYQLQAEPQDSDCETGTRWGLGMARELLVPGRIPRLRLAAAPAAHRHGDSGEPGHWRPCLRADRVHPLPERPQPPATAPGTTQRAPRVGAMTTAPGPPLERGRV